MAMFTPSQSHSGGVIVKPYTGNIAQELQFLTGEKKKKPTPFYNWVAHGNPVITYSSDIVTSSPSLSRIGCLFNKQRHPSSSPALRNLWLLLVTII